jgi:hypothetical protein
MADGTKIEWTAGAFKAWLMLPNLEREQVEVAGWIREPFALDFRSFLIGDNDPAWRASGWVITHLPTGYSAFAVHAPLKQVMAVVDRLNALGDWSFDDAEEAAKLRPAARELTLSLGDRASHASDAIAPWNSFGMKDSHLLDGVEHRAVPA